jgi:hypothetical protein
MNKGFLCLSAEINILSNFLEISGIFMARNRLKSLFLSRFYD